MIRKYHIQYSQTADVAPRGRATQQSQDTRIGHKVAHNKTQNNYRIQQWE